MNRERPLAVTGATGFLGTALLQAAARDGWPVRALTRQARAPIAGVEWVVGDVLDPAAVTRLAKGSGAVVHAAASLHGSDDQIHDSIVTGTSVVAAAAADAGVRLIHLSSLAVIDPDLAIPGAALGDTARRDPNPQVRGGYSRAKIAAEQAIEAAVAKGLAAVVIRPAQLVGDGLRRVPPSIAVRIGPLQVALARLNSRIALVHVADVAEAILLIAATGEPPGIVTLVDPLPVNRAELLRRLRRAGVPGAARRVLPMGWMAQPLAGAAGRVLPKQNGGLAGLAHRLRSIEAGATWECGNATLLGWEPTHLARWQVGGGRIA